MDEKAALTVVVSGWIGGVIHFIQSISKNQRGPTVGNNAIIIIEHRVL